MGFGAEIKRQEGAAKTGRCSRRSLPEDLIKFGMIPEFVGRLPVVATLEELDEEALVRILKEPKNSLVRQYQTIFEFEDVKLRFTDEALRRGRRARRSSATSAPAACAIILEEIMLDLMYTVPSQRDIQECVITEDVGAQPHAADHHCYRKAG